jgi:1-acyl-sn-glycerol-3-phosphate acyltransferase
MTLLKNIFARIWALWGLITFIGTFLIIFIPSMLTHLWPEWRSQDLFIKIARLWMRVWLTLIGCPVKVRGKENFSPNTSYIITCNHNTLLDVPLSSPFIPGPNKTIAKTSFAKVPIFGFYYSKGSVLVDRNSEQSRRKSFDEMRHVLKVGMHMCIYPEGTRNRTGQPLKKFYDGAFKLATDTGNAIIPTLIFNTGKALPVNKFFYLLPHKLEIHFLPPIESKGKDSDALKDEVYQMMWNYYSANR